MIAFTVHGNPVPQGSKRIVPTAQGQRVIESNDKRMRPWRQAVRDKAVEAMQAAGLAATRDPVSVNLYFYFARPQSHYGSGRNRHALRPSAPRLPAVAPDIDKLARAALDALTGSVFHDDKQVVLLTCRKSYDDSHMPGLAVEVLPLAV